VDRPVATGRSHEEERKTDYYPAYVPGADSFEDERGRISMIMEEVFKPRLRLLERKAGPMQKFIRGGEKDFRMFQCIKTAYDLTRILPEHVMGACFFPLLSHSLRNP
jgi:hypothetical protein